MTWNPNYVPPLKGKGSKLTRLQTLFIDEYMVDFVAKQAVLRAGYKVAEKNAERSGAELLAHPLVKAEIDKRMEERRKKTELSAEYVIQKLISIVDETDKSNPQAALRGLELLGKHLGLYRDRQEISGPDGEAIKMEQKVQESVQDFTQKLKRLSGSNVVPIKKD